MGLSPNTNTPPKKTNTGKVSPEHGGTDPTYGQRIKAQLENAIHYENTGENRGGFKISTVDVREINPKDIPTFGVMELRQLRLDLKVTQGGLGDLLGVSRRTVEGWEVGKRIPGPAQRLLYLIAEDHSLIDRLTR